MFSHAIWTVPRFLFPSFARFCQIMKRELGFKQTVSSIRTHLKLVTEKWDALLPIGLYWFL